jgi:cellulose synthase/poly-beta-1,6-N-acetylglucosamine synthase-like glycosyltransferase
MTSPTHAATAGYGFSANLFLDSSSPAISVIVPTYNEEIFIADCLTSLLDQDFDLPYEIIVVDGPSLGLSTSQN